MNVGPLGMIGSAAGSPLSQANGSDTEKRTQQSADQSRRAEAAASAERASGIGQTEQDEQASDRDADGRRLWERANPPRDQAAEQNENSQNDSASDAPQSKDASGISGNKLDLSV